MHGPDRRRKKTFAIKLRVSLSDSLDWEIAQRSRRGVLSKTILLIHRDHAADGNAGREAFEKQLGPAMETLFR